MSLNDTYNHYVHKYNVFDYDCLINTRDKIPPTGFRSVYAVDQKTAEELRKNGVKGYKGPVWSPVLSVDIDSHERGQEVIEQLTTLGFSFSVWSSGNKGIHLEIDRVAPPSDQLPYWDRKWIQANIPAADTSIYSHLHMFRLNGTRHQDTGNKKTLLGREQGNPVVYDQDDMTNPEIDAYKTKQSPTKSIFNDEILIIWTAPANNGERHQVLKNIATKLRYQYDEPREFTLRYLHHVNLLFSEPKSGEEIERIVEHFYGI